ncbi:MAG: leucyl/phenylalanyl-tRNA--protein transferase [Flavobacteriales bacterium]|jgi:leucyl/phenylalanyl-tRNA--protein transferase|nr:leucyl/phenylalanyl-tRNA--protein transferase [Flavobacteriales bacterium]MBK6894087.1 leucyl/phenylalanyl-tRNA--protein transferase [Flavobacteriales bacterium]MBK7248024.1 leucyl/phenylalanyl-tRNA--protein transferase [Flavobacteriales bacterium]MBK7287705.1 leucyl/phenylalanyl-tRNA--protein transferase [Flavobacteriales bacterium]MBK9059788.1 leucyl/phenylalanyl-tRNA--protein transferase [Flavobacteriales bacterium]
MTPGRSSSGKLQLTADLLLAAYKQGFFPMGDELGELEWHSPDPRAVFPLEAIRPNARFLRFLRNSGLNCTRDTGFEKVMRYCATAHGDTWITEEMIAAYTALHRIGHAHSVETWEGDKLVGGTYGVSIGAAFFGESMFSLVPNASKAAFHHLADHLRAHGFTLFDSQYLNDHTASLGAIEIPRPDFLELLKDALQRPCTF